MSGKTIIKRLADLERLMPLQEGQVHQLIVHEGDDTKARIAALIASGEARENDKFIIRQIVSPQPETPDHEDEDVIQ